MNYECNLHEGVLLLITNSELNLKAIFRPGRFRDAPNNQRMASAFPGMISIYIDVILEIKNKNYIL